jgi:hypothetical protein
MTLVPNTLKGGGEGAWADVALLAIERTFGIWVATSAAISAFGRSG